MTTDHTTARGLGLLSLGLGLTQLLAPRWFAGTIGVRNRPDDDTVVRLVGARELVAAAGLLTARNPAPWVWLRVGGDLMDLALLGRVAGRPRTDSGRVSGALAGTVAVTAVDVASGLGISSSDGDGRSDTSRTERGGGTGAMNDLGERIRETVTGKAVRKAITVRRSTAEV